jgi:hypothetical protein
MIEYETAKQLKDAGLKQEGYNVDVEGKPVTKYDIYMPTFLDIFEACEPDLTGIYKTAARWWVSNDSNVLEEKATMIAGKTIEEALARFYVALKDKEKKDDII